MEKSAYSWAFAHLGVLAICLLESFTCPIPCAQGLFLSCNCDLPVTPSMATPQTLVTHVHTLPTHVQTLPTHVHTINPFPSGFLQPPFIVRTLDAFLGFIMPSLLLLKSAFCFVLPPPGSCDASKVSLEFTICCPSPTHTLWLIKSFTCLFLGSEKVPSQYVCHEYMRAHQLQRDGILGGGGSSAFAGEGQHR